MRAHQQLPPNSAPPESQVALQRQAGGKLVRSRQQKPKAKSALRRVCVGFTAMIVMPVAILAALAAGVGYFRLQQGPVLVNFLAAPVKQGIDQGLQGLTATFDDVILTLAENGALELRLRNLSLSEVGGDVVVAAPQAAIELNHGSLWSMSASPERIELIEPRISLLYSRNSGFALSFSAEAPVPAAAGPGVDAPKGVQKSDVIDVAALVQSSASYAEQVGSASTTLREIGLRNATLMLDAEGRRTYWQVPRLLVGVGQENGSNIISGSARVSSAGRIWAASFRTVDKSDGDRLSLTASVQDVVPKEIAAALPGIDALAKLDTPVSAEIKAEFGRNGELLGGELEVDVSGTHLPLKEEDGPSLPIDSGMFKFAYDPSAGRVVMRPSQVKIGLESFALNGEAVQVSKPGSPAVWTFKGWVAPAADGADGQSDVAIQSGHVRGRFVSESELLQFQDVQLALAGGSIGMQGEIDVGTDGGAKWEGTFSGMPVRHLTAVWPKSISSSGRQWLRANVSAGKVQSGTLSLLSGRYLQPDQPSAERASELNLEMEVKNLVFTALTGLNSVSAEHAVAKLQDEKLVVSLPAAAMDLGDGEKVAIEAGQFVGSDIMGQAPSGEVSFKFSGPASAIEKLAEAPGLAGPLAIKERVPKGISGRIAGEAKVGFPLGAAFTQRQVGYEVAAQLSEGRIPAVLDGRDITGASLDFSANSQAIDAKGEFHVDGVLAKMNWQWIVGADSDRQPPLRLTATLDAADRKQLGIELGEMVLGDVPVELTVERAGQEDQNIHIRADLTSAVLSFGMIGWVKPAGRRAFMDCDLEGHAPAGERVLSNFRVTGSDIAIEGKVGLNAKGHAKSFDFPRFSLDLVSRLKASGELRKNGVWSLKLAGKTYQGRAYFRSLFSVGGGKTSKAAKASAGYDVVADIDNVLGFEDVSIRNLKFSMSSRRGELTALKGRGKLDGGSPLAFELRGGGARGRARRLLIDTTDAGRAFKLIGFYPNMVGGRMRLEVDLDGSGAAEKTGTLWVENFKVLGDPVVSEVVGSADESVPAIARKRRVVRQVFEFDTLRAPFSVGHGQIVLHDAAVHGALLGATLRGKADFRRKYVDLGGTYVLLQGLNNAFAPIPLLGELLSGPRKEGIFGTNYAIRGPMSQPQVFVHPLSSIAPGIFREIFQLAPQSQTVSPRTSGARARPSTNRNKTGSQIIDGWGSQLDTD